MKTLTVIFVCGFLYSHVANALFYTNSKENDYPRIGKREYSAEEYIENENSEEGREESSMEPEFSKGQQKYRYRHHNFRQVDRPSNLARRKSLQGYRYVNIANFPDTIAKRLHRRRSLKSHIMKVIFKLLDFDEDGRLSQQEFSSMGFNKALEYISNRITPNQRRIT